MTNKKSAGPKATIPWWVSLMTAITAYVILKYLAPTLNPGHPGLRKLFQAAPTFAPLATIPFLLLAAKQLYDGTPPQEANQHPAAIDADKEKDSHQG